MTSSNSNLTLSWKRPWSVEEIIQSSQCWSLAADSGVCELLKSFSTDLLNEVAQLNNNISELSVESKQTNVLIQNAFNDFCMLANNQFMENLVEDVGSCPITNEHSRNNIEVAQNKEEKLAQIIPQVAESLKMGIQVLESQFEILDVQRTMPACPNTEESDTDNRSSAHLDYLINEPIYHPKDPYENRHLPHLIGTLAFVEDDTLGIGYIDDVEENPEASVDSEHSECIPGDDSNEMSSSSCISESENEEEKVSKPKSKPKKISSSGSENIFDDKVESDDDLFKQNPSDVSDLNKKVEIPTAKPVSISDQFQVQLRKKLGIDNGEQASQEKEENISPGVTSENIDKKHESSKVFENHTEAKKNSAPFQSLANVRRTSSENSADDEEDDLFADISYNKMKGKSISNSLVKTTVSASTLNKAVKNSSTISDVQPKENQKPKETPTKSILTLQSDSDDDLFAPKSTAIKTQIVNTRALSTNSTNQLGQLDKANENLNGVPPVSATTTQSDSDGDLFLPKPTKVPIVAATNTKETEKRTTRVAFLDSDSDDDDLFQPKQITKTPPKDVEKSESARNIPKVEPNIKTNNQIPKDKKPPPISVVLESSSDDGIFDIPLKFKSPVVSNQMNEKKSINPTDSVKEMKNDSFVIEEKRLSNCTNDVDFKETSSSNKSITEYVSVEANNLNSSTNNSEESKVQEEKNYESDEISPSKNNEVISNNKKLRNNHPLAESNRHDPVSSIKSSDEDNNIHKSDSGKLPVATPRNSMHKKNNTGLDILDTSISQNSKNSPSEIEPITERESLLKLPPGAKSIFGGISQSQNISFLGELKNHQRKSKLSFNSETVPEVDASTSIINQDLINSVELPDNKIEPENQKKVDFKQKLQSTLNIKPFQIPAKHINEPNSIEEKEIDLEQPAEEVRQLTLLTKSRARNIPRRRPNVKKAGVEDTLPILNAIPNKIDATPQSTVEPPPIIIDNQLDDALNIFSNLPSRPEKKSKSNKKSTPKTTNSKTNKPIEVNVDEIDDIFAIATSKPSKKTKTKSKIVSDPLGAL